MLSILTQFLSNRSQHVMVDGCQSKLVNIVSGVLKAVFLAPYCSSCTCRVSEWCDLWGMKLNSSKTKTMIVSRSRTMHPQSPPLSLGRTVAKESNDLVILGVTFDSKMTFEKHIRSVSRSASQKLGILRKYSRVLDHFLGDGFRF